jgi:hypothetical protein
VQGHFKETHMSAGADDFFSGGLPSAKFDQLGKVVGGRIVRVADKQVPCRDMNGKPQLWDDGSPKMQLPIDVQTDERDPEIVGDTGVRTLYVKQGSDMKRAIGEAVRKVGATGAPKVGGTLEIAWTGEEPPSRRGNNPKKLYAARYTPPAAGDGFFGDAPASNGATQPARTVDPFAAPPAQQPSAFTQEAVKTGVVPANPFASDEAPF